MKISKTLGIGTGTVQRVLMEQPRPFAHDNRRDAGRSAAAPDRIRTNLS